MAFFGNSAVNRVNIHYGIQSLATAAGGVFFLVFLLRAGVPVPFALLSQSAILVGRFAIRPLVVPFAKRFGLKPTMIFGVLAIGVQYPLLAVVHGVGPSLAIMCFVASVGEVFYWSGYHAYFAALGDAEHRGHQVGIREAVAALTGIVAPLMAAWGLVTIGPIPTFGAIGLVQALSALPLFGAPNIGVKADAPGALRAARFSVWLFAADGLLASGYYFVWQIALFVAVKQSFAAYGGAMALAALVGAAGGLVLGRRIDLGHGRRATYVAYGVATTVILLRAASVSSPWLAVAANAPGALVAALVVPTQMTAIYNLAQASPCPLRFHIAAEGGWDLGCFIGCTLAAIIFTLGGPLSAGILLSLGGTAVAAALLSRYYAALEASATPG